MKKVSFLVLALPLLLVGCSTTSKEKGCKKDYSGFEIPVVDVDHIQINLPTMPVLDQGTVKREEGLDIIDIYEMSDFHAMIDYDASKGYFGLSGLANYMKEKRDANGGTILVSSGDMWQGGAESNLTRGKVVQEAMRYIGFDSMSMGNHEFDWGEQAIKRNHDLFADLPILCGNLVRKSTGQLPSELVSPSKVVTRGDYKIGIVGTIGLVQDSIIKTALADFEFTNPGEFARSEAARLRSEENCDIVIWTSHEDAENITVPEGVDVVFGGHTHANVSKGSDSSSVGHYVPVMETLNYGGSLAHVQLKIDPSTKNVSYGSQELVSPTAQYLKDESNIANLVSQYRVETDKVKKVEIGELKGKFTKEDELANVCVKAMYEYAKEDGAVFAFQNGRGGVRADISEGVITYGDIYTALPFDNELVTFEIDGKDVENEFDSEFKGLNVYSSITNYSDIKAGTKYKVVTTDFNALRMKNIGKITYYSGSVIRDVVAKYISRNCGLNAKNFKTVSNPSFNAPTH